MIGLPRGVTVYAFDEPCDMLESFDTLAALVTERTCLRRAWRRASSAQRGSAKAAQLAPRRHCNVPLKLMIDGASVTADSVGGCRTNHMLVYYAFSFEDSDRKEARPTAAEVPVE